MKSSAYCGCQVLWCWQLNFLSPFEIVRSKRISPWTDPDHQGIRARPKERKPSTLGPTLDPLSVLCSLGQAAHACCLGSQCLVLVGKMAPCHCCQSLLLAWRCHQAQGWLAWSWLASQGGWQQETCPGWELRSLGTLGLAGWLGWQGSQAGQQRAPGWGWGWVVSGRPRVQTGSLVLWPVPKQVQHTSSLMHSQTMCPDWRHLKHFLVEVCSCSL